MNMRQQTLAWSLALGLGLLASSAVTAHGPMSGQGDMRPYMHGGMGPGMMGGQGGMGPGMMGGQGGMGPGMMGGQDSMGLGMMGDRGLLLLLDEQQQRDMLDIRKKYRDTQIERMSKMMDMRDEMMLLMNQPTPDPDAIKSLHVRMAELHGDMMADRIRMQNEIHGLLTEEQRQQRQQRQQLQQGMSQP